jgi:cell division protein ZapA
MPLVDVIVNGREYQIACDTGQEDRLRDLGQMFDKRVQALAKSVGQVGDARLLLMAGLVLADELTNATARSSESEKEVELLKARFADNTVTLEKTESEITQLLEQAAIRIESIAARVAAP